MPTISRYSKLAISAIIIGVCTNSIGAEESPQLLERWETTKIDVSSIIRSSNSFFRSLYIFKSGPDVLGNSVRFEIVEGDALAEISGSNVVHILGNLDSDIYLDGNSELVIAGDVSPYANIYVNGITSIFVGGSFAGTIHSLSSLDIDIKGDYNGLIRSGTPTTDLVVNGEFGGFFEPFDNNDLSSASIVVYGFTEQVRIENIWQGKFVMLKGAFYLSDGEPGIYDITGRSPGTTYYTIVKQREN